MSITVPGMAWFVGLRIGVALWLPIAIAYAISPEIVGIGILAGVGGLLVSIGTLSALGSSYREILLAAVGTWFWTLLPLMIGLLLEPLPALQIALAIVWAFAASLVVDWSSVAASVSMYSVIAIAVVVQAIGEVPAEAIPVLGVAWTLGCLLALLMAVSLWPFRSMRAQRKQAVGVLRAVAAELRAGPGASPTTMQDAASALTAAMDFFDRERARRLERNEEDGRLFLATYTLSRLSRRAGELRELLATTQASATAQQRSRAVMAACADRLDDLADAVAAQTPVAASADEPLFANSPDSTAQPGTGSGADRTVGRATELVARDTVAVTTALAAGSPQAVARLHASLPQQLPWWSRIGETLSWGSSVFRLGLRLAIAVAFVMIVVAIFDIPYGYYCTLSVIVILKPDYGGTLSMAWDRFLGAVVGAAIAVLIALAVTDVWWIIVFGFLFTWISVLLLIGTSRWSFMIMITVAVLVLREVEGVDDFAVLIWFAVLTVAAFVISLVAQNLVLPVWQRNQLPKQVAASLSGLADYARLRWVEAAPMPQLVAQSRRIRQENINLDMAYQAFAADPKRQQGDVQQQWLLIVHATEIAGLEILAGAAAGSEAADEHQAPDLAALLDSLASVFAQSDAGRQVQLPEALVQQLDSVGDGADAGTTDQLSQARATLSVALT